MIKNNHRISITAILYGIYLALIPVYQVIMLSNGSTIIKYFVYAIIILCLLEKRGVTLYNKYYSKPCIAFLCWSIITLFWSINKPNSFGSLISLSSYIIMFSMLSSVKWNDNEESLFRITIIVSCIVYSVLLITSYRFINGYRTTLIFGYREANSNVVARNIAVAIPLLISYLVNCKTLRKRIVYYASIIIIIYAMISTGSRGAIISLLVALLFMLKNEKRYFEHRKIKKYIIWALLFSLIVIAFLGSIDEKIIDRFIRKEQLEGGSGRLEIWNKYFEVIFHNPLVLFLGCGYGCAQSLYSSFFSTAWPPAVHNTFLEILISTGIIGLTIYLYFANRIYKSGKEKKNTTGITVFLISFITGFYGTTIHQHSFWSGSLFAINGALEINPDRE